MTSKQNIEAMSEEERLKRLTDGQLMRLRFWALTSPFARRGLAKKIDAEIERRELYE